MTPDQIAESRERFERETAEHEMPVLRDDGLYRHLRCQKPGTWSYGFDLVTWPGYLAVVGDCGDFVFSRTRDMFEFFAGSGQRINPDYWSEKLQAPKPDGAERYSYERFQQRVMDWFNDAAKNLSAEEARGLREAIEDQLFGDWSGARDSEHEAHRALRDFEHAGLGIDTWEWSFREYDWQFLWCCHAILWGIAQYRSKVTAPAGVST